MRLLTTTHELLATCLYAVCALTLTACFDERVPLGQDPPGIAPREDGGEGASEDAGGASLDAGATDPCDAPDACGPLPPTLPCGESVPFTIVPRCIRVGGGCDWERRECPCEIDWCGPEPETPPCPDGEPTTRCERQDDDSCGWTRLTCPAVGEPCRGVDPCGPEPPGLPCGDGVEHATPGACLVTEAGTCDWVPTSCACDDAECVGAPPDVEPCDDGRDGAWCSYDRYGACDWVLRDCDG